jgi:CRISPR-associated protein Cas1
LHPTISYLHGPGQRRFSLALDVSEIFKPILADRTIFKLLNTKQIQEKHFRKSLNFCYLEESGRKIVLQEYDERLKTTIKHRGLGRNVSYRHLIRLEAYKLVNHLMSGEAYKAFRAWW